MSRFKTIKEFYELAKEMWYCSTHPLLVQFCTDKKCGIQYTGYPTTIKSGRICCDCGEPMTEPKKAFNG